MKHIFLSFTSTVLHWLWLNYIKELDLYRLSKPAEHHSHSRWQATEMRKEFLLARNCVINRFFSPIRGALVCSMPSPHSSARIWPSSLWHLINSIGSWTVLHNAASWNAFIQSFKCYWNSYVKQTTRTSMAENFDLLHIFTHTAVPSVFASAPSSGTPLIPHFLFRNCTTKHVPHHWWN